MSVVAAYDIPAAVHRAVLAGTDRIPTPRAQEGEVSETCKTCGHRAGYHFHTTGECAFVNDEQDPCRCQRYVQPADLSSAEQAPDAPEALRERVARAMQAVDDVVGSPVLPWDDEDTPRAAYRRLADAAIAAMRGAR